MPDLTKIASGIVTAPGAGGDICQIAAASLPAGQYNIKTEAGVSGNAVGDLSNMQLLRGASALVSPLPHGASGQLEDLELEQIALDGTQALTIEAIGAGTASIEYTATLTAVKVG